MMDFSHNISLDFVKPFQKDFPDAGLYLVGGALRDQLLGRKTKDFDLVITKLEADKLQKWFLARGKIDLVGREFGVYKFIPKGSTTIIDIALPRTEEPLKDGFGAYKDFKIESDPNISIEEDLSRRDFTINAMAYDLKNHKLIDPFDGHKDLKNNIIRAVGDPNKRFCEDLSRLLRAIRFAAMLDFKIEENTWKALREKICDINKEQSINGSWEFIVPRETIGAELAKAIYSNPKKTMDLLCASKALSYLSPEIDDAIICGKQYLEPLNRIQNKKMTLILAVIFRDLPAKEIIPLLNRLGLSKVPHTSETRVNEDDLVWIIREYREEQRQPKRMSALQIEEKFLNPRGKLYLKFREIIGDQKFVEQTKNRINLIRKVWPKDQIPELITGKDILNFNIPEGPKIKIWIERVRNLQLEGKIMTRDQALDYLKQNIPT